MIQIVGTVTSNLRDDVKANLVPLVQLGEELAAMIRKRVHEDGLAADGAPWSEYQAKRKPVGPGKRFYWTQVGDPAPEKNRLIVCTQGKYAGRSAYPSYLHWREAIIASRTKLFVLTAELRDSTGVNAASATRVTIAYNSKIRRAKYGRAKSGKAYSNQKVAQFAFRTERMSPMQPSEAEVQFAAAFVAESVPRQLLKDLQFAGIEASALAGAKRVNSRVNRVITGAGVRV